MRANAWQRPPLDLLSHAPPCVATEAERRMGRLLVDRLRSYDCHVEVAEVRPGADRVLYVIRPSAQDDAQRLRKLSDEVRYITGDPEAEFRPIAGAATVALWTTRRGPPHDLLLGDLLKEPEFTGQANPLLVALGRNDHGEPVPMDLTALPHLLVGSTTGRGKSSVLHAVILSLLVRTTPDHVRLLLVDPLTVEFGDYSGIPQLLRPVATDTNTAVGLLDRAGQEMRERFKLMEGVRVRSLEAYNALTPGSRPGPALPFVVVVIDCLADLVEQRRVDIELLVGQIGRLGRLAGVHLVVAAQRPHYTVITGSLKANFLARIALKTASADDSKTILGRGGAEKLTGPGDLLFMPRSNTRLIRARAAYSTDEDITSVASHWRDQEPPPDWGMWN